MSHSRAISLIEHFRPLPDPRIAKKTRHKLIDIVVIAICAIICSANDYESIAEFGRSKEHWFKSFLELPNGIPSHDTFNRVFQLLSPEALQSCFLSWVGSISGIYTGLIAIDGKTLRHSYDRRSGKAAIHMVSAWAVENGLVLGQVKTEEKSNEITAIPELLKALAIEGCIVSIDAMGCQKAIAKQIVDQNGDYVLAVKDNQPNLAKAVEAAFTKADRVGYQGYDVDFHETQTKDHGRFEIRRYWTLPCEDLIPEQNLWAGLNIIGMVESQRTVNQETTVDYRYYIGSIENNACLFSKSVRGHWGVENGLHWTLDVAFREDESRARKGHSPENFALLRHIALNLVKKDKSVKLGVHNKRLKAGWNESYLAKILIGA